MKDIAESLHAWHRDKRPFAVATVVQVSGSAPRDPGAALAVDTAGEAVGSVSGGCVESAVYELCREAITTAQPALERFGYSDEDAFAAGLTCGGTLDIFIQPVTPGTDTAIDTAITSIASATPVALARIIAGPPALLGTAITVTPHSLHGTLPGHPALQHATAANARAMLDAGRTGTLVLGLDGHPRHHERQDTATLFIESHTPPPRMIIFGAIDFAAALARIGKFLGYHVTVCDARPVFATTRRFPDADEIAVDWPHRYLDTQLDRIDSRTVLCVLTHDPKFDIPLLERALRLPVAYTGAMGSRHTHQDRETKLRQTGLTNTEINRLHSPIGLDLGARTPEETALSIAAEITAHHHNGSGLPLSTTNKPIHHKPHQTHHPTTKTSTGTRT